MAESNQHVPHKRSSNSSTNVLLDDVFEVLADRKRRHLIRYLLQCDPPVSITEIADALQTRDKVGSVDERRKLRVSLHHIHLPKLDEIDIVDYDTETNRVVGWHHVKSIEPYLDIAEKLER